MSNWVDAGPQITKLFPIGEVANYYRENRVTVLDKLLGKLRSAYHLVSHRPDNTSNVQKILEHSDPEVIELTTSAEWLNEPENGSSNEGMRRADINSDDDARESALPMENEWPLSDQVEILGQGDRLEPLEEPQDDQLEIISDTEKPPLSLVGRASQRLGEWLTSFLTYTFVKLSKISRSLQNVN